MRGVLMETYKIAVIGTASAVVAVLPKFISSDGEVVVPLFLVSCFAASVVFCRKVGKMDLCDPKNRGSNDERM